MTGTVAGIEMEARVQIIMGGRSFKLVEQVNYLSFFLHLALSGHLRGGALSLDPDLAAGHDGLRRDLELGDRADLLLDVAVERAGTGRSTESATCGIAVPFAFLGRSGPACPSGSPNPAMVCECFERRPAELPPATASPSAYKKRLPKHQLALFRIAAGDTHVAHDMVIGTDKVPAVGPLGRLGRCRAERERRNDGEEGGLQHIITGAGSE